MLGDAAIEEAIRAALETEDLELVELQLVARRKGPRLTVFVHNLKGTVDFDALRRADRVITALLDEHIEGHYRLDVSSPGLDRPLVEDRDFERNLGRRVKVITEERVYEGQLESFTAAELCIAARGQRVDTVHRADIGQAVVVPDWGTSDSSHSR